MADDLLANFRPSPFQNTGNDPGGAFGELGGGINPVGFASNVDNETADVIIDKDGITVIEGAIMQARTHRDTKLPACQFDYLKEHLKKAVDG